MTDILYPGMVYFISEYTVTLNYGGPEEGGWWYDWNEYEVTVDRAGTQDEAYAIARRMNEQARAEHHERYGYDYTSVLGGTKTAYFVEEEPGDHQSTSRPFYE